MDPNRYDVSEPELLLLRKLRATGAFAFTDGEPRCCRQAACSNVLWDPDSFGLSGRLAVSGDLLIVRSIPQHVVDDHEERMRHRHRGALLASISGDPAELPREMRPLGPIGGPGRLHQRRFQPAVARRRPATPALSGALVIAAGQARP